VSMFIGILVCNFTVMSLPDFGTDLIELGSVPSSSVFLFVCFLFCSTSN
jgi:hypothetical protein